jgi:hypothetical protein
MAIMCPVYSRNDDYTIKSIPDMREYKFKRKLIPYLAILIYMIVFKYFA